MPEQEYYTLRGVGNAEFVDRHSRFLATAQPIADGVSVQALIAERRKQYWDATHTVFAYVCRNGIARFSDDGEPQGTAGMPVLDVLQKRGLTDSLIMVTRYFGGILLGTGGLVHAYSQSAAMAVEVAGTVCATLCAVGAVTCSYAQYGWVAPLIAEAGGRVTDTAFSESVTLSVVLPLARVAPFRATLCDRSAGTLDLTVFEEKYDFF